MRLPFTLPMLAIVMVSVTQAACYRSSNTEYGSDTTAGAATTATAATAISPIMDTEWSLTELNGQPAGNGAGGKPATLTLSSEEARASGFAGCNRMAGTYTLSGSELRFSAMILTRMACGEGMDLETRYTAALGATRSYRATDKQLDLMTGDTVLARLTKP